MIKEHEKRYKQILPFDTKKTVKEQFGFIPLSVINPTKKSRNKWADKAYIEGDPETEMRRPSGIQYVQNLGFSEFHAGLAENIIRYWSLKGSRVVDPFSGRATRAVISSTLGREYYGYEISPSTVKRVNERLKELNLDATIYQDDGTKLAQTPDNFADLVFTCPPYWNLERYEKVPGQLSEAKSYDEFLLSIKECGENIERVMKPGSFCVWVCADFRGYHGMNKLCTFHVDTINLFNEAGLITHDIIILENNSPFAAVQMGKVAAKRYTSKIHEYILVFRKPGDYIVPDYCSMDDSIQSDIRDFIDFED